MPDFGANIIMQNAAMRGDFTDRLFQTAQLGEQKRQFNETMEYNRTKPKDLSMGEMDLQMIQRYNRGDRSPEVLQHLKARSTMEGMKTQYTEDPLNPGTLRAVTTPNQFEVLLGSEAAAAPSAGSGSLALNRLSEVASLGGGGEYPPQPMPMENEDSAVNRLMSIAQMDAETPDIPLTPDQFRQLSMGEISMEDLQQGNIPTLPEGASGPYAGSGLESITQGQATDKARADVQKRGSELPIYAAEKDVDASGKMAENYAGEIGTEAAKSELRVQGLKELKQSIESMVGLAKAAPSGGLETFAARTADFLGAPTQGSIALGEFESGKAISGLQSRIEFLKGQGTITDAEAKQALAFMPDANSSSQVKVAKLETAASFLQSLIENKPMSLPERQKGKPGFKYLGVKK